MTTKRWHHFQLDTVHPIPTMRLLSRLPVASVAAVFLDPPTNYGAHLLDETSVDAAVLALSPVAEEAARVLRPGGASVLIGTGAVVAAWDLVAEWAGMRLAAEKTVLWAGRVNRGRRRQVEALASSIRWHTKPGYRSSVHKSRGETTVESSVIVAKPIPLDHRLVATQKPVELYNYLVTLLTSRRDVVVDVFCGSGSVSVAAHMTGRRFVACDVDERCVEIARRRVRRVHGEREELNGLKLWIGGRLKKVGGW